MRIAVLGATGWIGGTIVQEAIERGHEVIALVRDTARLPVHARIRGKEVNLTNTPILGTERLDTDVVVASIGGRASGQHEITPDTAKKLLQELPGIGVKRLFWVGGAGSLLVASDTTLLNTPAFPDAYKEEAHAQSKALEIFRNSQSQVSWTFVSPAAEIFPGQKTGKYRTGKDTLLMDNEGHSRISVQDYAAAMLDKIEADAHAMERIGVAY
ncbi:NAD(P)-dependent oxidoreductase [Hahella ganghwensis]|uniref:NAD(P)-dependent oxidoreductase n=1 Tax=Hahella ganghwensis TaxID=286420 RepID=UPI000378049F|nr:NAD(P)H-binding protein [Hahella ganghwensis]